MTLGLCSRNCGRHLLSETLTRSRNGAYTSRAPHTLYMKSKFQFLVVLLFFSSLMAHAGAIRNLSGFTNNIYGPNDDGTYPVTGPDVGIPPGTPVAIPIGFPINFYGQTFSNLFLNNNGNVTFDLPLGEFTPFGLANTRAEIIAPFFADVDTRAGNVVTFGNDTVDGHQAFGVDWIGVDYFDATVDGTDKSNSFQLIVIDRSDRRPGDFDIEFNYDMVQWETGDASGGSDGLGGSSAAVGFSNGSGQPGTSLQFSGSGIPHSFLDINPGGLIHDSLNTNVLGRYIIPIVNLTNKVLNVTRLAQGDPRWGSQTYDDSGTNIQAQGSAVACLAMALNYAGIPTDPGQLNTLLENDHDFDENEVNWGPATRDASTNKVEFHAHRGSDTQYLSQSLDNGYPVIVEVSTASGADHFVLVIGEQNGHFVINDPGYVNATTLDYYNNTFETRGYVSAQAGDVSEFDIAAGTETEVLVVDPLGRLTGYEPSSALVVEQIPQSVHFSDSLEKSDLTGASGTNTAHMVDIYQPMQGDYQVFLISTNPGNYKLVLGSFSSTGAGGPRLTMTGTENSVGIAAFQVHLGSSGLTSEPYTNQCLWTASPTNGSAPLTVNFSGPATDTAGNSITSWYWNLGDGTIGTGQNPQETYANGGTYFPSLIAIDSAGNTVVSYGPSIFVPDVVVSANPTIGSVPLTVQFTAAGADTSGSNITSWNWDFGDGSTSTAQNPSHTYTNFGTFTPVLTAINSAGATVNGGRLLYSPMSQSISVLPLQIENGGFETGDFSDWNSSNAPDAYVDDGTGNIDSIQPHSGSWFAVFEGIGSPEILSQAIATSPGSPYLLSLWFYSDGATPNEFILSWNGNTLFRQIDIPATGWTNLQFTVKATGTNATIQCIGRNDNGDLGLDDVIAMEAPYLAIARSAQNMVISWPTNPILSTLQSTTNLSASAVWTTNSTTPVTVNGQNFVTNPISGKQMFFRLSP